MPVVTLFQQQAHTVTNPRPLPLHQAEFLLTLAAALVGPIALLSIAVSLRRRYKTSSHSGLAKAHVMAATEELADLLKHPRKSNTEKTAMSFNKKSDRFALAVHGTRDEDGYGRRHGLSQSSSGRQKRQEEPRTSRTSPHELRDSRNRALTPPDLSTTSFSFQDRRLSIAASTNGEFDPTLTRDTNLNTSSSGSMTNMVPNVKASSPISLRKSYAQGRSLDSLLPGSSDAEAEQSYSAFAPSSFPSASPILPLAPHAALEPREIDVTGEVSSVIDDSGVGWKRHTRVYGGGVCLACLASGDSHGGFYGENVPLDQRR
ncbi:hypothetical protein F4777DRAFT_77342 [Nemania sp. FL0916]|nr:hypothetical protein F4777DRAFT_77342 [Nemania sp. FL0916]